MKTYRQFFWHFHFLFFFLLALFNLLLFGIFLCWSFWERDYFKMLGKTSCKKKNHRIARKVILCCFSFPHWYLPTGRLRRAPVRLPISVKSPSDGQVEFLRIIMVDMMKYCTSVVASGRCDISKDLPDNACNEHSWSVKRREAPTLGEIQNIPKGQRPLEESSWSCKLSIGHSI